MHPPSILIIDDEFRTELYEMWLRDLCPVRTATTLAEALDAIDESVSVVLLRHELQTDLKTEIAAELKSTVPTHRCVVTTSEHAEVQYPDVECDTSICEPITEEEVVEVVDRMLGRALYHEGLRRYYNLALQVTNYEISDDKDASEAEYERLRERLAAQKEHLDEVKPLLDEEDYRAVLSSLQHSGPLSAQSQGRKVKTDKHCPDSCRECGLEWGEDYGGEYGQGYESLGAFTWKCKRCQTVQNTPSPSDRTVAR